MSVSTTQTPESSNPVLVDVYRKDIVESRHCGSVIAVNHKGETVFSLGDVERSIYPRSSLKFFQAIPLVETGAVDQLGLSEEELALACASHSAEKVHTEAISDWLQRLQLDVDDLENGPAMPGARVERLEMYRNGIEPTRLHHNCSGKHTGMLTLSKFLQADTHGYTDHGHPSQKAWMQTMSELVDLDVGSLPWERDGCGLPAVCMPMKSLAYGCALFARPDEVGGKRGDAMKRIVNSVAAHAVLVAGTGRCCTDVIEKTKGAVLAKTGAEGVFIAVLRDQGIGMVLKIDDGATRASEVLLGAALNHLKALDAETSQALENQFRPEIKNSQGKHVGHIQPSAVWDQLADS